MPMRNLLRGSGVSYRLQGKLTYQTLERTGLGLRGAKLWGPGSLVFSWEFMCSACAAFLKPRVYFPRESDHPDMVRGPLTDTPIETMQSGGGVVVFAQIAQQICPGVIIQTFKLQSSALDIMITVPSILSYIKREATLHS